MIKLISINTRMKKIIVCLSFLMLASLSSMGQNIKHISFDFDMDSFVLQPDGDGTVLIISDVHDYFLKSDTLLPALPYIGYNVLIGSFEQYDTHVCSDSRSLFRSNVIMAQNPEAIPTDMQPSTGGFNSDVFYSQRTYPAKYVEFVGMNEYDGYRLLTFHVCPFEYDATAQKLYLRTHIDLDIHLTPSPSVSQPRKGNREAVKNIIRQMVVNPDDLVEHNSPKSNRSIDNLTRQTGFEYVIVTSNQFKNTFQNLANWKSRKGIRSKVLTVEDIISTYNGSTNQEKIKNALADIDSLSYVLLGGDNLNVPTCMCYIGYRANTDSITPADIYYSCLGTMNWDSNGNGLYGELNDSFSLIPVLNVSRAPVSTIEDAQVFVNRIINYESAPDTTNWKDDILMCGTSLGYNDDNNVWHPYIINNRSDTQIWSQKIYNQYIAPYWDGQRVRFYDTYTDISQDGTYDFNLTNIQTELAKGYTFVDVMAHGNKKGWETEDHQLYDYRKANLLANNGYSVITTTSCNTNAFDYHTNNTTRHCLSQHLINNPQSGILAYWGTSRQNWYMAKKTSKLYMGHVFDALTYSKLFADRYHRLGKAATEVKVEKMSDAMPSNSSYHPNRKIWMGLNLMGDPEMPIYLSKPNSFQNVSILFVNDSIYVDTGTSGFDICFINKSDSTDYYIARVIADSVAQFSRVNGVFDASITQPGYVPFTTICDETYLQNITFTGTKSYETGYALIGSDVTNKVAQGAVVINSGNTTVKACRGVTITKDFEVEPGAEFTITN